MNISILPAQVRIPRSVLLMVTFFVSLFSYCVIMSLVNRNISTGTCWHMVSLTLVWGLPSDIGQVCWIKTSKYIYNRIVLWLKVADQTVNGSKQTRIIVPEQVRASVRRCVIVKLPCWVHIHSINYCTLDLLIIQYSITQKRMLCSVCCPERGLLTQCFWSLLVSFDRSNTYQIMSVKTANGVESGYLYSFETRILQKIKQIN